MLIRHTLALSVSGIALVGGAALLAVLSLESATTAEEQAASIQRLHSLGLAQIPPTATATPEAEQPCVDGGGAFCVYTVVTGDTLSGIATRL